MQGIVESAFPPSIGRGFKSLRSNHGRPQGQARIRSNRSFLPIGQNSQFFPVHALDDQEAKLSPLFSYPMLPTKCDGHRASPAKMAVFIGRPQSPDRLQHDLCLELATENLGFFSPITSPFHRQRPSPITIRKRSQLCLEIFAVFPLYCGYCLITMTISDLMTCPIQEHQTTNFM